MCLLTYTITLALVQECWQSRDWGVFFFFFLLLAFLMVMGWHKFLREKEKKKKLYTFSSQEPFASGKIWLRLKARWVEEEEWKYKISFKSLLGTVLNVLFFSFAYLWERNIWIYHSNSNQQWLSCVAVFLGGTPVLCDSLLVA